MIQEPRDPDVESPQTGDCAQAIPHDNDHPRPSQTVLLRSLFVSRGSLEETLWCSRTITVNNGDDTVNPFANAPVSWACRRLGDTAA